MSSQSPRSTALGQILTFSPSFTLPASTADGWMKHDFGISGLQLRISLGDTIVQFPAREKKYSDLRREMNDSSQKIGDFLLKGWTMLGDNCPHGCNVPLMRSRDKRSLVCLGCDTDFLAGNASEQTSLAPTENKAPKKEDYGLNEVLDRTLCWVVSEMDRSTSVSELSGLADLAAKLLALKNSIYDV